MEISKCIGCMEEFRGYPCPKCGYDPRKDQKTTFALPAETIVNGKYLMGRVLGQGGFGITYIGWDIALERKVAIKEYYPSGQVSRSPGTRSLVWSESDQAVYARQDGMQMFLKEARKMAKLEEIPGVVRIRDLFQENDTAYIVMDFVEGNTLKEKLKQTGPMSWKEAAGIFLPVVKAMEKVHEAGVIHRDLSPDNLMLTPGGGVRILDLGAAKDLKANSGASSMQVAKGGFSPLEQYTQRGGSGPWTDVYALAATIYYTLTGKVPPTAVDRVTEDSIRWDYPGLLSMPAPALSTLMKAMAVKASDRVQTMQELDMGLFSGGVGPVPGPNPNPGKKLPKWLLPGLAAVVVVAACLALSGKDDTPKKTVESPKVVDVTAQTTPETEKHQSQTTPETQKYQPQSTQVHFMVEMDGVPNSVAYDDRGIQPFWGQKKYTRDQVEHVVFQGTLEGAPDNAWDVSEDGDDSVVAWMTGSTLHVAADGLISPNKNGAYLFEYFKNLQSIDFGGCFDTAQVTSMKAMFFCCKSLEKLDVSGFDTARVTDMGSMFWACGTLTRLDVTGFDTAAVTDMRYMFWSCGKLTSLDVSGFDTARVTDMNNMFCSCGKLTSLDVSNFDTRNVTDMGSMFACCFQLKSLDLSNFNTSNVTTMFQMFRSCWELTDLNLSGFRVGDGVKVDLMFFDCKVLNKPICSDSAILDAYRNRNKE